MPIKSGWVIAWKAIMVVEWQVSNEVSTDVKQ